jgi:hypothetical protein
VLALLAAAWRRPERFTAAAGWVPTVIGFTLVLLATYAFFLRQPGGPLTDYDAYALRTFANLYLTVPALAAALAGFWLLARDRFWRDPALFITVAVFACSVFYKIRIVPEHFWMSRRFLPVVLPGALLFVAGAAFSTFAGGRTARAIRGALGATLVLLLAAAYARVSGPVVAHTEYAGLIPRLEALAGRFGDDELVIVESRDAGSDVHVLATPLAYTYARNVLLLDAARPDKTALAAFIEWARVLYGRVYFLGGGGTDLLSYNYGLVPIGAERIEVPEFEVTTDGLPRVVTRKDFEFGVYGFTDPATGRRTGPFDLDLGASDDLHVLRFHARELTDGRSFRWTRGTSYIAVTAIDPGARTLTLVAADGGRPPAAPEASVDVFLDDQPLGTITVRGPFASYTLPIPAGLAARAAASAEPVELRLVTRMWNPARVVGSADDRELGVMLDRVTIK